MADECEVALHIEDRGEGPRLVLLHGFAGSARNFRPQIRAFGDAFRVVAFDARGHARSGSPADARDYSPECFVSDLARVIDPLRQAPVALGGLSMGAAIALRYAIGHSERIYALVLASFPSASDESSHREWAMAFADAIEQFGLDEAGERFVWGERSRFDPKGAALIRQGFLEHRPHALAHTLRQVLATQPTPAELRDDLEHLHLPTLLIAGANDSGSRRSLEELARYLPNAKLVVIDGAGHIVNLEAAERFNAVLREFLEEHAPGAAQ
jgi:pimeloyl-ACP methyl ester carboxylesterase